MAERCYIHGPTTTAGTCPTCDAMQREDNEITRLRARLAEAEAAKADAWDEAMSVVIAALPGFSATHRDSALLRAEIMSAPCFVNAIRALVNPYRSKTDD